MHRNYLSLPVAARSMKLFDPSNPAIAVLLSRRRASHSTQKKVQRSNLRELYVEEREPRNIKWGPENTRILILLEDCPSRSTKRGSSCCVCSCNAGMRIGFPSLDNCHVGQSSG